MMFSLPMLFLALAGGVHCDLNIFDIVNDLTTELRNIEAKILALNGSYENVHADIKELKG